MAKPEVIETIYGKHHKYEIVKLARTFSTKFVIYRDGKYHRGEFSSLRDAVDAARKDG